MTKQLEQDRQKYLNLIKSELNKKYPNVTSIHAWAFFAHKCENQIKDQQFRDYERSLNSERLSRDPWEPTFESIPVPLDSIPEYVRALEV